VSLTVAYARATCKVAVSLHYDQGRWKLLGIGVELPAELKISQAQREERVKACKEPMDIKHCDVQAADAILRRLKEATRRVWGRHPRVQAAGARGSRVRQLQLEHLVALSTYRRIIAVTEAKVIGDLGDVRYPRRVRQGQRCAHRVRVRPPRQARALEAAQLQDRAADAARGR
jgi:hypothetical protein